MKFKGVCYRAHDPRWATSPLSGAGAAIRGARFNPKEVPALYLATSIEGAIAEASQGFGHKIHPLTICAYELDCEDIADLTLAATRQAHEITMETLAAAWAMALAENKRPPSWEVYDRLARSHAGILVPSFARGSGPSRTNLVLWDWHDIPPHRIDVIDPARRLPRNQKSWQD